MKLASGWSTYSDSEKAAEEAFEMMLKKIGYLPQLILVHSSCAYDNKAVLTRLSVLAPAVYLYREVQAVWE